MEEKALAVLTEEYLMSKIYIIRGVQVMLDADLAELYGYSTKNFNRQVNNNIDRFDGDFRFQLTETEVEILRCKNCTSRWGGARYRPYAFTELGIGTKNEMIFHCGGSSKDGGKRITSISRVEDVMLYQNIIGNLQNNPGLRL